MEGRLFVGSMEPSGSSSTVTPVRRRLRRIFCRAVGGQITPVGVKG